MIPAELLNQLREKDPETWEKWTNGLIDADGLGLTTPYSRLAEAWLQHCLQEAIRARDGWGCQITSFGLPVIANVYNRREYTTGRGDTEAEALHRAYLAAVNGG